MKTGMNSFNLVFNSLKMQIPIFTVIIDECTTETEMAKSLEDAINAKVLYL